MIMNKKLIVLVGLALAVIGLNGCSESSNASSHGVYAYIPNDNRICGWERVEVKDYSFFERRTKIETTDGRKIIGYNITIVEE